MNDYNKACICLCENAVPPDEANDDPGREIGEGDANVP